jgi:hypothetical protein
MNSPQQGVDPVHQLVHDIVDLIRLRPGALLRLPTSPCWGLALTRLGTALWVAISIAGCARIAAQRRPWVQARTKPDIGILAGLLAARFPHAEPREAPGSFLFALDETAGPCGRAVILAQASAERFPWMVAGVAQPLAPAPAVNLVVDAADQALGDVGASGAHAQDDLVSGGALPGADDPNQFVAAILARWDRSLLRSDDGRSRVRAALLLSCAQERQRLAVLHRAWPASLADNPYREPAWLAPAVCAQETERALSALSGLGQDGGADEGADVATSGAAAPTAAAADAAADPRRPLVVPTIRPAPALGAARERSDDEREKPG